MGAAGQNPPHPPPDPTAGQRRLHRTASGGAARVPQLKETRELFLEKGDAMDVKDKKTMEPEVDVGTAADVEEVMKKYDRESNVRVWEGVPKTIVRLLNIVFSVYCILSLIHI